MAGYKMLVSFFILATLIAFGSADDCCDANYNYTYTVSNDYQNWFQALINCASAGMRLATINSREENDNFQKFLQENNQTIGYWLGATDLGNTNWYWVPTGAAVVYTNWRLNQPDNATRADNNNLGEYCLQWGNYNDTNQIGWNDAGCNLRLKYICERDACNKCNASDANN